jgi:hypothetical protein
VFTNGTAFTEAIKNAFREFQVNLAFSVYADNASIHDAVTLRAGSFSRTVQSIEWALRNGLAVRVATVEMDSNSAAIEATREFFEGLGVAEVHVDRNRGVGRGSIGKGATPAFEELCGGCWEGKLCVSPSGDMFPCVFSRSWVVGTAADGVQAALEGRRLLDFRATLRSKVLDDAVDCLPVRDDPGCSPDQGCNPSKASQRHHRVYAACNPEPAPCIPAQRTEALPRDYDGGEKCLPACEKCIPAKRTGAPANSYR